jgi:uncharacterized beta-barrel protein YwiB (DUF1934 family)
MELVFYSLDNDNNKVFFRAEYKIIDNQIIFQDKATENTMIYLTINEDSLIFERKGNTSMTMTLMENIETFGHYESSAGLFFDFRIITKKLMVLDKRIEIEYTLSILCDVIGTHKIWITK